MDGAHREENCRFKIIFHKNDNTVELNIKFMKMTILK